MCLKCGVFRNRPADIVPAVFSAEEIFLPQRNLWDSGTDRVRRGEKSVALFFLFFFLFLTRLFGLFFFFFFRAFGFLHFQLATQQFDNRQVRAVAFPVSKLDDAAVAAIPVGKTGCNRIEYLLGDSLTEKKCLQLAAGVKIVALAERDHLLSKRTNLFCLRQSCHEAAVIQKIGNEITKQGAAVRRVPAEFAMRVLVSHITRFALSTPAPAAGHAHPASCRAASPCFGGFL